MTSGQSLVHIVDDDPAVRTALGRLLRAEGHQVILSASAEEFLTRPPDDGNACVLLDLAMPGLGGLAVQQRMREVGDLRPVTFLTGEGNVASGVHAMKAGAVDFLVKPVDGAVLITAIGTALHRGQEQRARHAIQRDAAARIASLTVREHEVMLLVIAGMTNKCIAGEIGIAEKTVKIHRANMIAKMGADSVASLVRLTAVVGFAPGARKGI